ncbi:MAG: hypothetical protein AAGA48_05685 [Myxococcota bacterium]
MQRPASTIDAPSPPPNLVMFGLAALFLVCATIGSLVTLYLGWRQVEDAMAGWLVLGMFFGIPFVGFLGAAAVDADRRWGRPMRMAWWLVAWGLTMIVHWGPVAVWPLVLVLAAFVEPHRFEQHAIDALWSTGALGGVGLGLGAVYLGRRRLAEPLDQLLPLSERPKTAIVPSLWSGVAIACGSAMFSMVWLVFMAEEGWRDGGMAWLLTWVFGALAMAVTYGSWLSTCGAKRNPALRAVGSALVGQALVPFFFALASTLSRDPELQYAYLVATVGLATVGAFVWGFARPMEATEAAGANPVTNASESVG